MKRGSAPGEARYTRVATAVVTRAGRILLVRRSPKMRSMGGLWACISGVIEGGEAAVDRALVEIGEEAGIGPGEAVLLRPGDPLRVDDPSGGRHARAGWEITPFLFEARTQRVRLNWENTAYRWARRADLGGYETVPRLDEVIDQVMAHGGGRGGGGARRGRRTAAVAGAAGRRA